MAYVLDTIDVIATNLYKEVVLKKVFRCDGSSGGVTEDMQLRVITTGSERQNVNVRFTTGSGGTVYTQGYEVAMPAGSRIIAFEFREIGETALTATVALSTEEQKYFEQQGILFIDEIRFGLNVSLA